MKTRILPIRLWTRSLAALAIAAVLSSCSHLNLPEGFGLSKATLEPTPAPEPAPPVAEKKPPPEPIKPPPPSPLYEWNGTGEYVSRIEISINEQKARFYSGDNEVGWTTVASGLQRHPTPVGTFAVIEKVKDKRSNIYGRIYSKSGKLVKRNAKMGVHSVPSGGRFKGASMPYFMRLTNDGIGMHAGPIPRPGSRASHGCIRMPKKFAPILYRHVDIGTPVTIKGNGPAYASYVRTHRASPPEGAPRAVPKAVAKANTPPTQTTATAAIPSTTSKQQVTEPPGPASKTTAVTPKPAALPDAPPTAADAVVATPISNRAPVATSVSDAEQSQGPLLPESSPPVAAISNQAENPSDSGPVAPALEAAPAIPAEPATTAPAAPPTSLGPVKAPPTAPTTPAPKAAIQGPTATPVDVRTDSAKPPTPSSAKPESIPAATTPRPASADAPEPDR